MSEDDPVMRYRSRVVQLEQNVQSLTSDLKASNARLEAAQRQLAALAILEQTTMNTQARRRLSLETDMRRALEAGEFTVHYQPLVEIATRRVTSLEALVRWHHPTRGPISPGEFIPVAEESDLILSLGEHVLRTVCEQVVRWEKEGIAVVPVAVNISAIQLQRQQMWKFVRGILRETGMRPQLLALEITESSLIKDAQKHIKELHGLRRDGVHIEIDDFGTGYSSLSYLKRLPIDMLKIDRSFISQIDTDAADEAIVSAILAMANSLGIKVVAEGVETQAQLDVLRYHGCETAQGFFFGRPLPADQCRKLLFDVARRPSFTETLRLELVSGGSAKSLAVA